MKFATVFAVAIIMDAAVVSEANLRGNGRAPPQSRGLKGKEKGKDKGKAKGKAKDKGGTVKYFNNRAPANFGAPQITQGSGLVPIQAMASQLLQMAQKS